MNGLRMLALVALSFWGLGDWFYSIFNQALSDSVFIDLNHPELFFSALRRAAQ